jgi:Transposase IS66 family
MLMGAAPVGATLRGGTKSALFCLLGPFHRTVCRHPPCSRSSRSWCALYAPGRGAVHLHTLLKHYRGIVQCDGYAPYKKLPDDAITLAFCWAHVRRGFFEIARKGNAPIATQALMRIAALYRIEQTIRGKNAEQRVAVRREQSAPHLRGIISGISSLFRRAFPDHLPGGLRRISTPRGLTRQSPFAPPR